MPIHSFGEAIRNLRLKSDFSLRELAKQIDVSPPFLSDIELESGSIIGNVAEVGKGVENIGR